MKTGPFWFWERRQKRRRRLCLRRWWRGINFTVHQTGVLHTVLSVGPRSGSPGAGFALKDGGKNGSAVPGHHCYQHVHAGRDGADSSVHAIRPPQLAAVSTLSSDPRAARVLLASRPTGWRQQPAISAICSVEFRGGWVMSKHSRDIELLRQIDNELMVQYEELLCLRAELARLLFPLKISPPRKNRIRRKDQSASRPVKRNERPASCAPILLLVSERPQA